MKICVVAPIHDFNDVRVVRKEVRSAVDSGFECILICASNLFFLPEFCRVIYIGRTKSLFLRCVNIIKTFRAALSTKADLYHCHNPDASVVAILLIIMMKKVVYETHENFPSRILSRTWISYPSRILLSRSVHRAEYLVSRFSKNTIVTQYEQLDQFFRTVLVRNLPIVNPIVRPKAHIEGAPFFLCYVGGISRERGIHSLLGVILSLNRTSGCRFELNLAGPCSDEYLSYLQSYQGWEFVNFHGFLPQEDAFQLISRSHLGLLLLNDVFDFSATSPNKLYEYCMGGIPFLATRFDRWVDAFNGCSFANFIESRSDDEIVRAVLDIFYGYNEFISNADVQDFLKENSWSSEFEAIKQIYFAD